MNRYLVPLTSLLLIGMAVSCGNESEPTVLTTEEVVKEAAQQAVANAELKPKMEATSDNLNVSLSTTQTSPTSKTATKHSFVLKDAAFDLQYNADNLDSLKDFEMYGEIEGDLTLYEETKDRVTGETTSDEKALLLDEQIMVENDTAYVHISEDVANLIDTEVELPNPLNVAQYNLSSLMDSYDNSYVSSVTSEIVSSDQSVPNLNPGEMLETFLDDTSIFAEYLNYKVLDTDRYSVELSVNDDDIGRLIENYAGDNGNVINNAIKFDTGSEVNIGVEFSTSSILAVDVSLDLQFSYLLGLYDTSLKATSTVNFSSYEGNMKQMDLLTEYVPLESLGIDLKEEFKEQASEYLPFIDMLTGIIKNI